MEIMQSSHSRGVGVGGKGGGSESADVPPPLIIMGVWSERRPWIRSKNTDEMGPLHRGSRDNKKP